MPQERAAATRDKLLQAGTELIRRKGFIASTVDDVCEAAGVTKGAFFHHFKSKEDLAAACLAAWDCQGAALDAPFQQMAAPRGRVLAYMDFYIGLFDNPSILKSCLAGTTAQEVAETNPTLRDAANVCFQNAGKRFQSLLDEACRGASAPVDTASLAALWLATMQGAIILYKTSRDSGVIRSSLTHVKHYIAGFLPHGHE